MKKGFLLLTLVFIVTVSFSQNVLTVPASKCSLDKGWRFHLGDIPFPIIKGEEMTYHSAKAGKAWGAAAPEFEDTKWRTLTVPHDWAVELPIDSTENEAQGFRTRGIAWYRRSFTIDSSDIGKHLELQFDAVATHCTVWLNGTLVHRNFCGYNSFYIDITPFANFGKTVNQIAIRVDAVQQEGWWYEGAGIYRHTWLVKRNLKHIETDGVFANPIKQGNGQWLIPVETSVANAGNEMARLTVEASVLDSVGNVVAHGMSPVFVDKLDKKSTKTRLVVNNPTLWTMENPALYKVKTILKEKGVAVDSVITTCGFRTFRFTADSGFFLNDKHIKLKGVCTHQDNAGVGIAVPDALWEYRIKKMKEMGVNAFRCSHNPPANTFLEACDRLGIVVMDENRNFNVTPEYTRQLEWMIRRDRNHPSIILWSVFNEEPMEGTVNGYEMVRRMTAIVKKMDTARPVTAAANGGFFTPKNVCHAVDVIGMNYYSHLYDSVHKAFPNTPLTSSEDGSAYMVRDEYVTDKTKCLHDSYDLQAAEWGRTHRNGWKEINERIFLAGCFYWTGLDYRGEPQPYTWPAVDASFGIMDQCGFPKAAYYIRQAQWLDKPVLKLVPHWNWPADSIGKPMKVMALTNADSVRLYLNGRLISGKKIDPYEMGEWKVPYRAGKLEAKAYKNGKLINTDVVETTTEAVALKLIPYRNSLAGDGQDAMPVNVQAVDKMGRVVPTANFNIQFEVSGGIQNIGVANGNPNSHEMEKADNRNLFHGLAQIIVQSTENGKGTAIIKAHAVGMKDAEVTIEIK